MSPSLLSSAILALAVLTVTARAAPAQGTSAPTVGTVEARLEPVSRRSDFVGRVKAMERVDVVARVKGYLQAVKFDEGEFVKAGAPLYLIEPDEYQAAVQQAEGELQRADAALALGTVQLKRAEELFRKGTGSEVSRDQAAAAETQARGGVTTAKANLETAKLNLSYTKILAPIAGRIGMTNVTKGNVVGPESGVLATIVTQDPMQVVFPVSQRELLHVRRTNPVEDARNVEVRLRFSDGSEYDQPGRIDFLDVTIDTATDTITARAVFPNPRAKLIVGQLVQVVLQSDPEQEKIVVPQAALLADQRGTYVFVAEAGKAVQKRVKVSAGSGANVVVEEGLRPGEQVIVEGLQAVRPNQPVRAEPVAIDPGRS